MKFKKAKLLLQISKKCFQLCRINQKTIKTNFKLQRIKLSNCRRRTKSCSISWSPSSKKDNKLKIQRHPKKKKWKSLKLILKKNLIKILKTLPNQKTYHQPQSQAKTTNPPMPKSSDKKNKSSTKKKRIRSMLSNLSQSNNLR